MANFLLAQPYIIKNEGGYADDPRDRGGETYRGISRKFFPEWNGWTAVDNAKPLERGQVIENPGLNGEIAVFYKQNFWDSCLLDSVNDQGFATYFYDFHVNAGANATKCLQRLLKLSVDGAFGPHTLAAVNGYEGDLFGDFHNKRLSYYHDIGTGKNEVFLKGWLHRANYMYEQLKENSSPHNAV